MSHLSVNGIELRLPLSPDASFQELINYLRRSLVTERTLISSVKVNGAEIAGIDDSQWANTPISQISSVEILTSHPKEIADDTLQNLSEFSLFLENLSRRTAEASLQPEFLKDFAKLVDGIGTFTEAVTEVKRILKLGALPSVAVVEADLLSILKDLLASQQKQEYTYMAELLENHLPPNLQQWRESALPAIARSRDC